MAKLITVVPKPMEVGVHTKSAITTAGKTITFSHVCANNQNNVLFVFGVTAVGLGNNNITGITYAGIALTNRITHVADAVLNLDVWTLVNPPSGSNNVVVTMEDALSATFAGRAVALEVAGVHPAVLDSPITTEDVLNVATISRTGKINDAYGLMFGFIAAETSIIFTPGPGQISLGQFFYNGALTRTLDIAYKFPDQLGNVPMSWTINNTQDMSLVVTAVRSM